MGVHRRLGRRLVRRAEGRRQVRRRHQGRTSPQFDVWDRYDFDDDNDFNEPDGYIDHFQAVHAGGGEEAGAR